MSATPVASLAASEAGAALTVGRRRGSARGVIIYTVGVLALSAAGGALLAGGNDIGGLVFVSGPLLMAVVLRTVGREGWSDAGLRFGSAGWYVFAAVLFPVTFGVILWIGGFTGTITLTGSFATWASGVATNLASWLVFATCEEWGWRGYLEPRMQALGIPDLKRHLLVGCIWAVWHVPYVVAIADYSTLSPVAFAPLFLGGVLAMAVVYGQLRLVSGTVWTVVLAHGLGNALSEPLVRAGMAECAQPALLATRPENLAFIALWVFLGWMLLRRGRMSVALSPVSVANT